MMTDPYDDIPPVPIEEMPNCMPAAIPENTAEGSLPISLKYLENGNGSDSGGHRGLYLPHERQRFAR